MQLLQVGWQRVLLRVEGFSQNWRAKSWLPHEQGAIPTSTQNYAWQLTVRATTTCPKM
jgi:hypothetical protein